MLSLTRAFGLKPGAMKWQAIIMHSVKIQVAVDSHLFLLSSLITIICTEVVMVSFNCQPDSLESAEERGRSQ